MPFFLGLEVPEGFSFSFFCLELRSRPQKHHSKPSGTSRPRKNGISKPKKWFYYGKSNFHSLNSELVKKIAIWARLDPAKTRLNVAVNLLLQAKLTVSCLFASDFHWFSNTIINALVIVLLTLFQDWWLGYYTRVLAGRWHTMQNAPFCQKSTKNIKNKHQG